MPSQYETDYHQWAIDTAKALRDGRFSEIDIEAAAEEIEDLARSQRRALRSALVQLFLHLLKTRYQPDLAGRSWEISIEKQRVEIADLLDENPSLRRYVVDPTSCSAPTSSRCSKQSGKPACRGALSPRSARSLSRTSTGDDFRRSSWQVHAQDGRVAVADAMCPG
jgi:hypothetical protein